MKRTGSLHLLSKGHPYVWGELVAIHSIAEYAIVEYHPWKTEGVSVLTGSPDMEITSWHGYVFGEDTRHSWENMDRALAGCIAYKYEGPNHRADEYFMKGIKKEETL